MVEKLISMGSISSLCEMFEPIGEVGMVRDYSTPEWKLIETTKPHSLYNRWKGVSTFYHRDGGQPLEITTSAHYLPLAMICEYNYLFNVETNEWSVAMGHDYRNKTRHWSELKWAPLSECLTPNKIN
ncbi:hypothetical protein E6Q11_05220 [Candidatus Dojkabacteria bacterium]|uniref:Uncharacterized protein n=1 Tax=Candidatus Dojkabacteria bacterium TaxID=2099670 RepID=A0A5C7J3W4_9BACT|nr:MAG: hypothetical protein E6Q11_05220 [Candidatus Dojkabacteria bacterium]